MVSAEAVNPTSVARVFWKPTLYRSVIAIVFALLGIFWVQDPPETLVALSTAGMFLLTALLMWPVTRLTALPERLRTGITAAALGWAVAGILLCFLRDPLVLGVVTAFGLVLGGIGELVAGWGHRELGRPAIDEVISGGLALLGAVILVLVCVGIGDDLDAHGVFGTSAMIIVVLGVHQLLAAIGYRRDASKTTERS